MSNLFKTFTGGIFENIYHIEKNYRTAWSDPSTKKVFLKNASVKILFFFVCV